MDFSEIDMKILLVSSITILLIGATAGATPVAGGFGEMPVFEYTASIDFTPPEQPGQSELEYRSGTLRTDTGTKIPIQEAKDTIFSQLGIEATISVGLTGDIHMLNASLILLAEGTGNFFQDIVSINVSETAYLEIANNNENFEVKVTYTHLNESSNVATVDWEVTTATIEGEDPSAPGPLSVIASWLIYLGELLQYIVAVAFGAIGYVFTTVTAVVSYIMSLIIWLTTGYASIVTNAPTWASPFIAIPVVLFGFELLKLLILLVQVIWIG